MPDTTLSQNLALVIDEDKVIGLLQIIAETQGGYRLYDYRDAASRIKALRQIRAENPTLKEVKEIMDQDSNRQSLSVA